MVQIYGVPYTRINHTLHGTILCIYVFYIHIYRDTTIFTKFKIFNTFNMQYLIFIEKVTRSN